MDQFNINKKNALTKLDKSKKGDIDKDLVHLLKTINKTEDYFTTSSCSGRILITAKGERKDKHDWLLVSHESVKFLEIQKILKNLNIKKDIWFKQEPFIIHICCRTLEDAETLLLLTRKLALKRSGIISTKKDKIMVEIIGSDNIETIIARKGIVLVDESYLKILLKEINFKLKNTKDKIKNFYKEIKNF